MTQELNALFTRKPIAWYLGWLGYGNLGDEVVRQAIGAILSDRVFLYDKCYVGKGMKIRSAVGRGFDCALLGGGTLVFLRNHLEAMRSCKAGKKIIFGSGVVNPEFWMEHVKQRLTREDIREWVDFINTDVERIYVRGPLSRQTLMDAGVRREISVSGDPALLLCKQSLEPRTRGKTIGINWGRANDQLWGLSDESAFQKFRTVLLRLTELGWRLVLMPVWKEDRLFTERLVAGLPRAQAEIVISRDGSEFVENAAKVDLFIGEKLHAVILAACAHTPVIMIEYRPKCLDFMKSMQLERFCLRADRFDAETVGALVAEIERDYELLRTRLLERGLHYKKALIDAGESICRILNS